MRAALAIVLLAIAAPAAFAADPKPATPIEHFVVLMQENHTFDNYFGSFPGAEGTQMAQTSTGADTHTSTKRSGSIRPVIPSSSSSAIVCIRMEKVTSVR